MKLKWRLMCFYLVSIIGVVIYLKGFFPVKIYRVGHSTGVDVPPQPKDSKILLKLNGEDFQTAYDGQNSDVSDPIPRNFTKVVLVVVNSLRHDFVFSQEHLHSTRFMHKMLRFGDALGFVARAQGPAVTMPRIKALITGSVPSYSDIILSLDEAKELNEDSFVNSAFSSGLSVVFYGDDTWTKMFPGKFKREGPVKDFLSGDTRTADQDVTRNMEKELTHPDNFDVMILHYLGLGHVGHIFGTKSQMIVNKLMELDYVVQQIYERLEKHDSEKNSKSLIVVTGDHGMTDKGSHGGTTHHERDVPLVFLSPGIGKNTKMDEDPIQAHQIDLVPTLSVLMGVPIPRNSMGQILRPLVEVLSSENQLHALQYNNHHLLSLAGMSGLLNEDTFEIVDPVKLYRDAVLSHATWLRHPDIADKKFKQTKEEYLMSQAAVSDQLMYHVAAYNYLSMGAGMVLMWAGYIAVIFTWAQVVLTTIPANEQRSGDSTPTSPLTWGVLVTLGTIVHGLSLLSSSFLEEEHQTWYFVTATFLMVLFLNVATDQMTSLLGMADTVPKGFFTKRPKSPTLPIRTKEEKMELLRRSKSEDSVDSSWDFVELENSDDEYTFDRTRKFSTSGVLSSSNFTMLILVLTLLAHRLLRGWNSTGIQNVDELDIGDWFNDPDHHTYLILCHAVGLVCTAALLELLTYGNDKWRRGLTWAGFVLVFIYRITATRNMENRVRLRDILPAALVYLIICGIGGRMIFLKSKFASKSTGTKTMDYVISGVVLLSALLLRSHNIWGLVFNLVLYWSIFRKLWPILGEDSSSPNLQLGKIVLRTTLCYWFGQMAYFSFGNSNSLAAIDVSAGYVGIPPHAGTLEDTAVRLLILYATYIGPIVWTMLCLADAVEVTSKEFSMFTSMSSRTLLAVFSTFAFLRLTPMAFYLILASAMRFHVFVWSVFAPKLLFETASTVIYGAMLLAASLSARWLT